MRDSGLPGWSLRTARFWSLTRRAHHLDGPSGGVTRACDEGQRAAAARTRGPPCNCVARCEADAVRALVDESVAPERTASRRRR
jgi:hypothetical protein